MLNRADIAEFESELAKLDNIASDPTYLRDWGTGMKRLIDTIDVMLEQLAHLTNETRITQGTKENEYVFHWTHAALSSMIQKLVGDIDE